MDTERNELEQALFRLGRNHTRVNDTITVASKLGTNSELYNALTQHWQSTTDSIARIFPAINKSSARSRDAASNSIGNGVEFLLVAALALWHAALEEYYFELLQALANHKPDVFKPGNDKKFQLGHVLEHDTRQYNLCESYRKLCKLCGVQSDDAEGIRAHKTSLKETTQLRIGVIHKGELLPGEWRPGVVIREQYDFACKFAMLVGGVAHLDIT